MSVCMWNREGGGGPSACVLLKKQKKTQAQIICTKCHSLYRHSGQHAECRSFPQSRKQCELLAAWQTRGLSPIVRGSWGMTRSSKITRPGIITLFFFYDYARGALTHMLMPRLLCMCLPPVSAVAGDKRGRQATVRSGDFNQGLTCFTMSGTQEALSGLIRQCEGNIERHSLVRTNR